MLLNPALNNARPLMIVGLPRCGTRFIANAFNEHPAVHLNGEIPPRHNEGRHQVHDVDR